MAGRDDGKTVEEQREALRRVLLRIGASAARVSEAIRAKHEGRADGGEGS